MVRLELPSSIAEAGSPPGSNRAYLHSTTSPVLGAIAMLPLTGIAISSLDRLTI